MNPYQQLVNSAVDMANRVSPPHMNQQYPRIPFVVPVPILSLNPQHQYGYHCYPAPRSEMGHSTCCHHSRCCSESRATSDAAGSDSTKLAQELDEVMKEKIKIIKHFGTALKELSDVKQDVETLTEELKTSKEETSVAKKDLEVAIQGIITMEAALKSSKDELKENQQLVKELSKRKTELEKKVVELSALEVTNKELQQSYEAVKKEKDSMALECGIFQDLAVTRQKELNALKESYEDLKLQIDTVSNMNIVLSQNYKELVQRHLYLVTCQGEQMYQSYLDKHTDFYTNLESQSESESSASSPNKLKQTVIKRTLDCIKKQIQTIAECRQKLRASIGSLAHKIGQGVISIVDMDLQPKEPHLDIPMENFKPILLMVSSFDRSITSKDGVNISEVITKAFSPYQTVDN